LGDVCIHKGTCVGSKLYIGAGKITVDGFAFFLSRMKSFTCAKSGSMLIMDKRSSMKNFTGHLS